MLVFKGANRYQKVVGQNGRGKEFRGYFCPKQGLSALNFRGGAEKVVVHMHWLTWLLWRPCTWHSTYRYYFTWFVDHLTLLSFRCKSQILNIRKCHDFLDSLQKILTNDVSGKKFFVFPNVFRVFLRVETRDRHIHSKIMYWLCLPS